jgi:2-polyprenyl-3-methyl-5-hydroxy-6-metoxy-1,4-benzoquinol methylase
MDQYKGLSDQYKNKPEGYYSLERDEMLAYIPWDAQKILDIGCGEGGFGKNIKSKFPGVKVWGIEPDSSAAGKASLVLDKVIEGSFGTDMPALQEQQFDCIIFNDVLEHLLDPGAALRNCQPFLSPGGIILASIPNILYFPVIWEVLTQQDWRYEQHGTLDNTHLRFFTRKSILRLFDENGYEVVGITGINPVKPNRIFKLLNTILYKRLNDWRYLQFAVQAKLKTSPKVN